MMLNVEYTNKLGLNVTTERVAVIANCRFRHTKKYGNMKLH